MPTASGAPASLRIVAKELTPATSSTVDQAICLMAPFCSFGNRAVRITAAVIAAKPMLRLEHERDERDGARTRRG